jgi:hypothetical protein
MQVHLISGISPGFPELSQSQGQVTHVLLTRSPLIHPASWASPFDLHVLSTPPAFVLSQDQTLRKCSNANHTHPQAGTANKPYEEHPQTWAINQTGQNRTNWFDPCPKESQQATNNQPQGQPPATRRELIGIDYQAHC